MEKVDKFSLNIINKNIKSLRSLFPEIFNEEKIDLEKLSEILGEYKDNKIERYNFSWPGKSKAIRIAQTQSTGTLRPSKKEGLNWDKTKNLYIEGDNLEVLKILQKSYNNAIDFIYIDPPYNTGNDFVYNDNFKDNIKNYLEITNQIDNCGNKITNNTETSGRYHSNWLNMMYPRLKLARNLLKEDGIIVISIDDYEINNLINLCNEIFGEDNKLQTVIWQRHAGGGNDSKYFAVDHEYLLVICKNKEKLERLRVSLDKEDIKEYTEKDEHYRVLGPYKTKDFKRMRPDDPRPTLRYEIIAPDGTRLNSEWRWEKQKFEEALKENKVLIQKNTKGEWSVKYKLYLNANGEIKNKVPRSLLTKIEKNSQGKKQLTEVMVEKDIFNNPKPLELIKYFIDMKEDNITVLDFFSGSGTTAQAVMEMNAEDNGDRKYIMIQLPEVVNQKSKAAKLGYKTICEIGKERIRRAAEKISEKNKEKVESLDTGFKVFKLDSSNINKWDLKDGDDIETKLYEMTENIKKGRTEEDVLYEILLKYGIDLNMPIEEHSICGKKVFDIGFGAIIACLDNDITLDIVEGIGKLKEELSPEENECRVVFMDSGFATDSVKTNAIQILKRYKIEDVKSI